ncbi:hypothetical protein RRG08_016009 [Elysia crispata]|uniref:Uncharacterized protein n=1 Tax=Elysia crispata TaxID=231223 RepID=A0AAE0YX63_9GAST|nr:hypothetical protein RRG08_016009 [Elysia crispata]
MGDKWAERNLQFIKFNGIKRWKSLAKENNHIANRYEFCQKKSLKRFKSSGNKIDQEGVKGTRCDEGLGWKQNNKCRAIHKRESPIMNCSTFVILLEVENDPRWAGETLPALPNCWVEELGRECLERQGRILTGPGRDSGVGRQRGQTVPA